VGDELTRLIDRRPDDVDSWDWFTGTRGRVASLRPDDEGTIRASMSFESEPMGFEGLPVEAQFQILRERFRGAGWQTERILDGFDARPDEFYTQRMEQVVMSTWSRGRIALVGDAVFHALWQASGLSADELWPRHANLE